MLNRIRKTLALTMVATMLASNLSFAEEKVEIKRISGKNRYETSAKISREYATQGNDIILASGENFADALAGGPLSIDINAPILLTQKGTLPKEVELERNRLNPKKTDNLTINKLDAMLRHLKYKIVIVPYNKRVSDGEYEVK